MVDPFAFDVPSYGPNPEAFARSRAGAEEIRPKAPSLRERVYQFISGQGDYGATDQEGQAALSMKGNTYRPRRWELFHAERVKPATDASGEFRYREGAVPTGDVNWRYIHRSRQLIWVMGAAPPALRASFERAETQVRRKPNMVDKTAMETIWLTPEYVLDCVRAYFGGQIPLDPATQPNNPTKARVFWTEADDGLAQSWAFRDVFVNPPYGKAVPFWTAKIRQASSQGATIIVLLAGNRWETKYFQRDFLRNPNLKVICPKGPGRISFLRADGTVAKQPNVPSIFYGFNVDPQRFAEAFAPLGPTLGVKLL